MIILSLENSSSFFLLLFVSQHILSQEQVHLNDNGEEISEIEFQKKWRDKELFLTRWDYIGEDSKRYATLKNDLYLAGNFNYNNLKTQLEKIIGREISDDRTIIIEYYYKDDLCTSSWDNKWTKGELIGRKKFTNPIRKDIDKKDINYIVLFEEGIVLKNKPDNKDEYFYTDKNNYFGELLFTHPTLCGSFALIKPNGQTLIRNGEYRADDMTEHLKPENWNIFFETED